MSRTNGSLKKRICGTALAVALTASVVGTAVYMDSTKAHAARVTLRGIQELANAHSTESEEGLTPFVIIEVVDDYNDARLGYLVGGEEPINVKSGEGGYAKSIKDMPSKDERTEKVRAFADVTDKYLEGENGAYTYTSDYEETGDGSVSMEIRGSFESVEDNKGNYNKAGAGDGYTQFGVGEAATYDKNNDGKITTGSDTDEDELQLLNENNVTLYRRMYNYSVSEITGLTAYDSEMDMPVSAPGHGGAYNWQYFKKAGSIDSVNDFEEGIRIYAGRDTLVYKGTIENITTNDIVDGEENVTGKEVVITDTEGKTLKVTYDADGNFVESVSNGFLGGMGGFNKPDSAGETLDFDLLMLCTIAEANGADSELYYITDVAPDSGSEEYVQIFGEVGSYTADNVPSDKDPYYIGGAATNGYVYTENNNGDYVFKSDYKQRRYESFSYNNGINNHEWFKQFVFDRSTQNEYDNLSIDVVTVRASELTAADVARAGLIYFNYLPGKQATNDIKVDVAKAVISAAAEETLSVMMEYATYIDGKAMADESNLMNMALALMKSSVPAVDDDFDLSSVNTDSLWFGDIKEIINASDPNYSDENAARDISYVNRTIFVNDNYACGSIVGADFNATYADDKTNKSFSAVVAENAAEYKIIELQGGSNASEFNQAVSKATSIRYILNKNKSRTSIKSKLNILDIEPYESDQYVFTEGKKGSNLNDLNYYFVADGGAREANIAYFEYRDIMTPEWVTENLGFEGNANDITIREMGTKELVGVNIDFNSTYDMIYIGADTALISTKRVTDENGKIKWQSDATIKSYANTLHNDSSLDGLIYTHMGDRFDDFVDYYGDKIDYSNYASGNDITIDKLRELKSYIQAGYAVIISDTFVTKDGKVNTGRVDISSNMYNLIAWLVEDKDTGDGKGGGRKYYGRNVRLKSDLETIRSNPMYGEGEVINPLYDSNISDFSTYINISKLNMEVTSEPVPYNNGTYLSMASDGNYYLNFTVQLRNDSSIDTSERTTYDCKLYLDMDADGKYEAGESLGGLMINEGNDIETDGHFHLTAGKEYRISRAVPPDYVGFLSWKLEFSQNEREGDAFDANAIRVSETGFSAVPVSGEKPTIRVLQIIPNKTNSNIHWGGQVKNTYRFADGTDTYYDYNYLNLNEDKMHQLYDGVQDFDLDIMQIKVEDYITRYHMPNMNGAGYFTGTYYDFLSQFDMVVMGFSDGFSFALDKDDGRTGTGYHLDVTEVDNVTGNSYTRRVLYREAMLGIRQYMLSGRSILFTHDLTSELSSESRAGYFSNQYLRDIMGMDRFGMIAEKAAADPAYFDYTFDSPAKMANYNSIYDTANMNGNSISEKKAFTDFNIIRDSKKKTYGIVAREHTKHEGSFVPETVTQMNPGQITQYPYYITDDAKMSFSVNETHAQWFQLNLDTDSTDDNTDDDIVVWYVLSHKENYTTDNNKLFYKAVQMDARNNYYIYTKGNVTYTGAGHRQVNDEERKLFVNTLVAAYNSGLHAPRVIYKENPRESAVTISSTYMPYDSELVNSVTDTEGTTDGGFLDSVLTVNFRTANNNFRTSTENLNVKYYVQVASGGTLTINGIQYKEIEPVSIKIADASGNLYDMNVDESHRLLNYRIYQTTFNLSDVNMTGSGNLISADSSKLYIRIGMDELEDGDIGSEPATESMNELNVFATRLFDLE